MSWLNVILYKLLTEFFVLISLFCNVHFNWLPHFTCWYFKRASQSSGVYWNTESFSWSIDSGMGTKWGRWTACWFSSQMSPTPSRGTPWIRLTWLLRPSVRRYNRVSLCTLRKQPLQQTSVRWGDFPLIPNSIISHHVNQ